METTPQGQGKKPRCGPGIVGTLIAIIIAFLAGIVVGLHPTWIPINVRGAAEPDFTQPDMSAVPGTEADRNAHAPGPPATTEPAATESAAPTTEP